MLCSALAFSNPFFLLVMPLLSLFSVLTEAFALTNLLHKPCQNSRDRVKARITNPTDLVYYPDYV